MNSNDFSQNNAYYIQYSGTPTQVSFFLKLLFKIVFKKSFAHISMAFAICIHENEILNEKIKDKVIQLLN